MDNKPQKINCHFISNTHWDREWRFSARRTQYMLGYMLDMLTDILDKYSTDAKYLLPILKTPDGESRKYYKNMSKQVNRWLKKIGTMVGIQIPLTMYVARHTWASLAKQKNGGWGVMLDDVLAGFYALLLLLAGKSLFL